jgi:hypothetical protein
MIPHPSYAPTLPCESLACDSRRHVLMFCEQDHCPHAWQRRGAEDWAKDAERDRRERKGNTSRFIAAQFADESTLNPPENSILCNEDEGNG